MDVFLSYVNSDHAIAERLANDLKSRGFDVWLDHTSLRAGDRWVSVILEAVRDARNFIALVSKRSASSRYFNSELATAIASAENSKERRTIIPIVIEEGAEIPSFLRQFQAIDATKMNYSAVIDELYSVISDKNKKKEAVAYSIEIANEIDDKLYKAEDRSIARYMFLREIDLRQQVVFVILLSLAAMGLMAAFLSVNVSADSFHTQTTWSNIWAILHIFIGILIGYYFGRSRISDKEKMGVDGD